MSSPSPKVAGTVLGGRYLVERKLGSGSLGTVYLAYDMEHAAPGPPPGRRGSAARAGKLVALKVLRAETLSSAAIRGLKDEFRTFAALRHPQIAAAHDFGYLEGGAPYYTREYVPGAPLPAGPPGGEPSSEFLRPILDLLDALEYLHGHGLLHLDVHPGNVIVADDRDRGSVLIDFGLLRSRDRPRSTTASLGLAWPPELLLPGKATPASDLFMAGVLLIYRLTGRAGVDPRLPAEIQGWGSRATLEIERIAAKAVRPAPRQRFASARAFRDALAEAIGTRGLSRPPSRPADLTVGREAEIAAIHAALDGLAARNSAVVAFTGRAGIGKSRLLEEARIRAQLRGLTTVDVRFAGGTLAEPALTARLAALRGLPRGEAGWLEPLSREHGGTPGERAKRAAKAYFSGEGRPLVFLMDDVELADPESRLLLEALAGEAADPGGRATRAAAIITASAHALFSRGPGVAVRDLKPLGARDAERCLRALLGPLDLPRSLARRAAAATGGVPLHVRRLALAFREEWGRAGAVPRTAPLPELVGQGPSPGIPRSIAKDRLHAKILLVLRLIERFADAGEIAAAAGLPPEECAPRLEKLVELELAAARRRGRERVYGLGGSAPGLHARASPEEARAIHLRSAAFLERAGRSDPMDIAHRARHLLRAGRRREGETLALEAVEGLRDRGAIEPALGLIEEVLAGEKRPARRLALMEIASPLIEETGSHAKGIALIEPLLEAADLPARRRVRLARLAGVHYHRGGFPEKALGAFEAARRCADPARDAEDLIFIESEEAELNTYRGLYDDAERACERGLSLLEGLPGALEFRSRMEIILRASLGHLELRRMNLARAREELSAAWRLVRGRHMPSIQAVILNNLGIAERQLGHFASARRRWLGAERLLAKAGEGRSLVKIACNLAVAAAHQGRRKESLEQVDRAFTILGGYPGERLEFFARYTRGVVAHLFGDAAAAIEALEEALPLGRRIGDAHLVGFGQVLLAEAHMALGRLSRARELLRAAIPAGSEAPLLRRMTAARRSTLFALLRNERGRKEARRVLETTPRSEAGIPEAWNDLHLGLSALIAGEPMPPEVGTALACFRESGVPAGERFARVVLLADALRRRDGTRARELLGEMPSPGDPPPHRLLAIVEPLVIAEARFSMGDADGAGEALAAAGSEIIGFACLELDWVLELLRGTIALAAGDPAGGRRHVHRAVQAKGVLTELVPRSSRDAFARHPRFQGLLELARRLEKVPMARTPGPSGGGVFEGMVGRSGAMLRVFETVEKLRGQDVPVLVRGETGTGKDLLARALHATSPRAGGAFLAVHCAALPDELLEAELFGHEAGAFTGAEAARPGLLETLAGGTLLLDEVEHLSPRAQGKLLQAAGAGQARRLGAAAGYRVDVRFLSSTSIDLRAASAAGSFRADLFFRLATLEIEMPALRARREDIPLLARHLLQVHSRRLERPAPELVPEALELLSGHDWPGNVRELEAILFRSLLELSGDERIDAEAIRRLLPAAPSPRALVPEDLLAGRSLDEVRRQVERAYVERLHREVKGDLPAMMSALGVRRTQLYDLFRRLGIDIRTLRGGPL